MYVFFFVISSWKWRIWKATMIMTSKSSWVLDSFVLCLVKYSRETSTHCSHLLQNWVWHQNANLDKVLQLHLTWIKPWNIIKVTIIPFMLQKTSTLRARTPENHLGFRHICENISLVCNTAPATRSIIVHETKVGPLRFSGWWKSHVEEVEETNCFWTPSCNVKKQGRKREVIPSTTVFSPTSVVLFNLWNSTGLLCSLDNSWYLPFRLISASNLHISDRSLSEFRSAAAYLTRFQLGSPVKPNISYSEPTKH